MPNKTIIKKLYLITTTCLLLILVGCVSMEGKKIDLNNFPAKISASNLDLSYEFTTDISSSNTFRDFQYDVALYKLDNDEKQVPYVSINGIFQDDPINIQNKIFKYTKNSNIVDDVLFQQNTFFITNYKGLVYSKNYKTPAFSSKIYQLSLAKLVQSNLENSLIKKSMDKKMDVTLK